MKKVAVVGVGMSKFGNRADASLPELAFESASEALQDAGIRIDQVDASVVGTANQFLTGVTQPGAIIGSYIGLDPKPSVTVSEACATGSNAIRVGWSFIESGLHDVVLVVGAEKMNEIPTSVAVEYMALAGEPMWELYPTGISDAGTYAMMARAHMSKYGTTERQLAAVAVKNHKYAAMNPKAQFRKEITVDDVLRSKVVADPLKLYDCSAITDGAAAVLLASEEKAKELSGRAVYIKGLGCGTDTVTLQARKELTSLRAAVEASAQAYKMAGVGPAEVDVACVHDCFTIAEILAYEDLGFCGRGEGGKFVEDGQTYIGGKIPVNVDGGLKAKGHPLGATGVAMVTEVVKQLRGEAGPRQVQGARIGLTHNVARDGTHCFVGIYGRE